MAAAVFNNPNSADGPTVEPPSFTPREAALLAASGVPTPSPGRLYCAAHAAARAKMGRPRRLPA